MIFSVFPRSWPLHGVWITATAILLAACTDRRQEASTPSSPSSPAVSLYALAGKALIEGVPDQLPHYPTLEWRFDGESALMPESSSEAATTPAREELVGWKALEGVEQLRIANDSLWATASGFTLLSVDLPAVARVEDRLDSVEIALQVSEPLELEVWVHYQPEFDPAAWVKSKNLDLEPPMFETTVQPSDAARTVNLDISDSPMSTLGGLKSAQRLLIGLQQIEGSSEKSRFDIELTSLRLWPRNEKLSALESGPGWHELSAIGRETIVSRTPESRILELELGTAPWLDLTVGIPDDHPVTFTVEVRSSDSDAESGGSDTLRISKTVTRKGHWTPMPVDIERFANQRVTLRLTVEAEDHGRVGFWGSPTLRHRRAPPAMTPPSTARAQLNDDSKQPQAVILILADTLRRDHLEAWGYDRPTAPNLAELAATGTRFADTISQGTWTKVSIPSILTSLYASSHGIVAETDRLPEAATTLTEVYRDAGYATLQTSSVVFSGKNSNLQQGAEVLHEGRSIETEEGYGSKTARELVDRVLPYIEAHREQSFFVVLHIFDPHSPFRPRAPFDRRFMADDDLAQHESQLGQLESVVEVFHGLPSSEDLETADIDQDEFSRRQKSWYDGSIRSMDAEIGRLLEKLDELELRQHTLIAFISDHGEEFFEHGNSWHGEHAYGEMLNVPMVLNWPGVVPAGLVATETTQSIDLMPTLLELSRLPVPEQTQGRSLLPIMVSPSDPAAAGWPGGPVFSEHRNSPDSDAGKAADSWVVLDGGWKLIWNDIVRDGRPTYQLFDHRTDPLNLNDVASDHPETVSTLKELIEEWRLRTKAERIGGAESSAELTDDEREQLGALGYVDG